jgi:hypothetical protein
MIGMNTHSPQIEFFRKTAGLLDHIMFPKPAQFGMAHSERGDYWSKRR